ncbi:NAD(P)H pyrophosphatase NUDT13, mitochondrial isoform X1 [Gasterosteus aculeatus]|uniref:NAD(+) diphosphatase n=2 Tax=Gasterosteus aculeatus aculeatus TaxID=481459 RepID=G3P7S5_GASAC|nr:nucleoside diphosphate-linked moiety X motif 13 isoform X1 [Gasterosteus aculeatus aculeatus]XP_040033226.1 nucleoside diphosphate-linked moiety X motif 13 isoform X1 [Gasterosteus aculeatus aculeatus]XP_040033227.1 nucleoside diphosphate-linked moiety X motif 13 isoform X1 [Gasterosteus aculeatus aculeatus]
MLRPLKIPHLSARCGSNFVSRMRYVNRLKVDDEALAAALENGHMLLFHRLSPLLQRTPQGSFRPPTLITTDVQSILEKLGSDRTLMKKSILLGCSEQNQVQFCLDVGELHQAAVEEECGGKFISLKKAFFLLTGPEAPLVAKGRALLRWHQTNSFCSATGEPTQRNPAGSQRVCNSSGIVYYPTMSPVVIVLVSDGKRCLLGRQSSFPQGMYSALAGFCDMGETVEETLSREVAEEVGLEVLNVSYSSSQHWPFPHSSFMMGFHASVSPTYTQVSVDHTELEDARWFSLEEITSALQVKAPLSRGKPAAGFWLPPKHAIANHLITEWTHRQRAQSTI